MSAVDTGSITTPPASSGGEISRSDMRVIWLLLVAAFVVCAAMTPSRSSDLLGNRVLTTLGRMSLVIYLWHFPIFHFVSRHTNDWPWVWRALVAFLATAAISWATQVVLERRISRLLARPEWKALRAGTYKPWDRRRHRVPTEG